MLHGFSTSRFLVVLLVLALAWYAGVMLFFYLRKKGRRFVALGSGTGLVVTGPVGGQSGIAGTAALPAGVEDDLMGKARLPEGMSSVGMEEVGFVDLDERAVEDQQGLIPDLLEEIKSVFALLAKEDGTKKDFLRLMKTVKENYPAMASHPRIRQINAFITGHAGFHISTEELQSLWY